LIYLKCKRKVYLFILSVIQTTQRRALDAKTSLTEAAYRGLKWGTNTPCPDF